VRRRVISTSSPERHVVGCPYCAAQFDLFAARWCRDVRRSKLCPTCARCLCSHPGYDEPRLWAEAPTGFHRHGFARLFVLYL